MVKYAIKRSDGMGTEEEKCEQRRKKKNNCLSDRIYIYIYRNWYVSEGKTLIWGGGFCTFQ